MWGSSPIIALFREVVLLLPLSVLFSSALPSDMGWLYSRMGLAVMGVEYRRTCFGAYELSAYIKATRGAVDEEALIRSISTCLERRFTGVQLEYPGGSLRNRECCLRLLILARPSCGIRVEC